MFDDKLRQMPFLRVIIPVVSGIILGNDLLADHWFILPGILLVLSFLIYIHWNGWVEEYLWNRIFGGVIHILLFFTGILLGMKTIPGERPAQIRVGTVLQIPVSYDQYDEILLGRLSERDARGWSKFPGKFNAYLEKKESNLKIIPGSQILFYCSMAPVYPPVNPREFDRRKLYSTRGIYWSGSIGSYQYKVLDKNDLSLRIFAERLKWYLIQRMNQYAPEHSDLLQSLLLGYREQLEYDKRRMFVDSGAMHILAVSGLHVGIIYLFIHFCLGLFIKNRKILISIFPLPIIWIFALMTGLSPSATRASLMITLFVLSACKKRNTNPLNLISFSALILILFNPHVINEISFQLSFTAVTGIALLFRPVYHSLLTGIWILDRISGLVSISLSAQIFTLPLSILYFNQISHFFLLTNLFAIPLATLILYAGFFYFLLHPICFTGRILIRFLDICAGVLYKITVYISSLPYATTKDLYLRIVEVISLYVIILSCIEYIRKKSFWYIFVILFSLIFLLGMDCIDRYKQKRQNRFLVYSIYGSVVLDFINGYNHIVLIDGDGIPDTNRIRFKIKNFWLSSGLKEHDFITMKDTSGRLNQTVALHNVDFGNGSGTFIQFSDLRIGVISGLPEVNIDSVHRLQTDIVLIYDNNYFSIRDLIQLTCPEIVIIDRNTPGWLSVRWEEECIREKMKFWSVRDQGYFEYNLN